MVVLSSQTFKIPLFSIDEINQWVVERRGKCVDYPQNHVINVERFF